MRHRKRNVKLGRSSAHRNELLANQVCHLIRRGRIRTTLTKAKALRPVAEKMVTLGKKGTLAHRRHALSELHQEDAVKQLFDELAPRFADRSGGYTRILKLGARSSDGAEMDLIEWVEAAESAGQTG